VSGKGETGLTLRVEGIGVWGRCGVSEEERAVGQRLVVDVRLIPRCVSGATSDELNDTVDYGEVVGVVRGAAEDVEYRLIERLADEICGRLLAAFSLEEVAVRVCKPAPPVGIPIDGASAEVVRRA